MRQVIETVLEADVEQYAKNLKQAERDTQAFKRRIEDSQAIKLSLDVATLKKEIEGAKGLLVKYKKEGNLEATVKLDAEIERLKLKLTSAKAELRNYAKTANKETSVLGLLFGDIGRKIDNTSIGSQGLFSNLGRSMDSFSSKVTNGFGNLQGNISKIGGNITDINSKVQSNINNIIKNTSVVNNHFETVGANIDEVSQKMLGLGLKSAAVILTAGTVSQFVGEVIRLGNQLEQTTISFETMLGSAEKADALLRQLTSFAMTTPFTITGLRDTTKQLLAFGIEQEKIIPTLKMLGDVAAGLSVPIEQIAYAYGQVRTANQLYGTELRQFVNAGVPLLAELAKMYGVTESEAKKMTESGLISFSDVEEAFRRMSSEGGRFNNLMQKQSESVGGMWSNLKDKATALSEALGRKLEPATKGVIGALTLALDKTMEYSKAIGFLISTILILVSARVLLSVLSILQLIIPTLATSTIGMNAFAFSADLASLSMGRFIVMGASLIARLGLIAAAFWGVTQAYKAYASALDYIAATDQAIASEEKLNNILNKGINDRKQNIKDLKEENLKLEKIGDLSSKKQIQINEKKIEANKKFLQVNTALATGDRGKITSTGISNLNKEGATLMRQAELEEGKVAKKLPNTMLGVSNSIKTAREELEKLVIGSSEFIAKQKEIKQLEAIMNSGTGASKSKNTAEAKKAAKEEEKRLEAELRAEEKLAQWRRKMQEDRLKKEEEVKNKTLQWLKETIGEQEKVVKKFDDRIDDLKEGLEKIEDINKKISENSTEAVEKIAEKYVELEEKISDARKSLMDFGSLARRKDLETTAESVKNIIDSLGGDEILAGGFTVDEVRKFLETKKEIADAENERAKAVGYISSTDIANAQKGEVDKIISERDKKNTELTGEKSKIAAGLGVNEENIQSEIDILTEGKEKATVILENMEKKYKTVEESITQTYGTELEKRLAMYNKEIDKLNMIIAKRLEAGIASPAPTPTATVTNNTSKTVNAPITVQNKQDADYIVTRLDKKIK